MDLKAEKIALAKLILDTEDADLILLVKEILSPKKVQLSPEEKVEIELGLRQIKAGQSITLEDYLLKLKNA